MNNTPCPQAGIFVPLFALRGSGDQGIGDTRALKEMIQWCAAHKITVLQILPINETSGDNSPYNAVSSVALEPTTLSIRPGDVPGLSDELYQEVLGRHDLQALGGESVVYSKLRPFIRDAGFNAMDHLAEEEEREFDYFCESEKEWLEDYVMFRALMESNGGSPVWTAWPECHVDPMAAAAWREALTGEAKEQFERTLRYYQYIQWVLARQWQDVKSYAEEHGVGLMGDIPFGVSRHSADVWSNAEEFNLDWSGGAPPEPFFQHDEFIKRWGQNWGIPPYRWEIMEQNDYAWWRRRVREVTRYFNLFRIDHILGFYRLYSFPWTPERNAEFTDMEKEVVQEQLGALPRFFPESDDTEAGQQVNQAHGEKLLRMVLETAGDSIVVGEDLGVVPDYVRPSLLELGISGFKIPVFERNEDTKEFSPVDEYPELTVCTLSTHDHLTMRGMWQQWWTSYEQGLEAAEGSEERSKGEQDSWELYRAQRFLGLPDESLIKDFEPLVREAWISKLLECPSWLTVLMITDLFGWDLRFNVPGPVADSNWSQRLPVTVQELSAQNPYHGISQWLKGQLNVSQRDTLYQEAP